MIASSWILWIIHSSSSSSFSSTNFYTFSPSSPVDFYSFSPSRFLTFLLNVWEDIKCQEARRNLIHKSFEKKDLKWYADGKKAVNEHNHVMKADWYKICIFVDWQGINAFVNRLCGTTVAISNRKIWFFFPQNIWSKGHKTSQKQSFIGISITYQKLMWLFNWFISPN